MNIKNLKYKIINSNLVNVIFIFIQHFFSFLPIKNNKVVFQNFNGKGFGDNPKYIANELIKKENIDIVWIVKEFSQNSFPNKIRQVKKYTLRYFYELATAKVWVSNNRLEKFIIKRKNQVYIQTWHGGLGLKKVEKDAEDKLSKKYIKLAKKDSKMIDYAISNSTYRTNIYKNSFWYDGKILEIGCPRNDIFFDNKKQKKIRESVFKKYNIDFNKKIILYAPTFRSDKDFDYETFNFSKLLNNLNKKNENYVLMIKLHPNVDKSIRTSENIINVSKYPDVDELLLVSDIVISDYSSVFFDFLFMHKPVYLYAPDYDEYVKERGFNFDYKKLPFSISYNSNELINKILVNDYKNYADKLDKFLKDVNIIDDGHASQKVANLIDEILKKGDKRYEKI